MAKKKSAKKKAGTKAASGKKNSLVKNINRRKRAGKSRTKKDSTISSEAYKDMQNGWK